MFDPKGPNRLLELDARLRNKDNIEDRIIARTAAVKQLLELGSDKSEISRHLKLNPYIVDTEVARIEKEQKETRRFLATGQMPRDGGYFAILQR